jgi:hypothetical protein
MEKVQKFFFIRPRRFGKGLWISVLIAYYDINGKDKFDALFEGLYIKENSTDYKSNYMILKFLKKETRIAGYKIYTFIDEYDQFVDTLTGGETQ